jgi:hypothetical protein
MQAFLQKPLISDILKGKKPEMITKKERNEEEIRKANTQNKVIIKKLLESSNVGV